MMTEAVIVPLLAPLHDWFAVYCASFQNTDVDTLRNFTLKEVHTHNVCQVARLIAQGGEPRRLMLAEVAALCHDLGRFPQFRDFRTFKDSESLNHAHLSAQIVEQNGLVEFLPEAERRCVLSAVRLHNVFQVPSGLAPATDDLLRLLRDADKIDIWRVFIEYYHQPASSRAFAAGLGFPDLPFCSPEVLAAVRSGEMVQLSTLKSLNDFKLLQLSWVYDINFANSLRLIKERGTLEQLAATLPCSEAVLDVVSSVRGYLEARVADA
jgi:hypothetical protein